ncbi:MAG TPA: hypothetical protein DHV85_21605 [Candidatus Accumulibacter sp.]|nr:hypothetical protein [Accumulibacter sp.]
MDSGLAPQPKRRVSATILPVWWRSAVGGYLRGLLALIDKVVHRRRGQRSKGIRRVFAAAPPSTGAPPSHRK